MSTSCNSTYWVLDLLPEMYWRPIIGSLIAIVSLAATIENALILLVFYKYPALRTSSNKILLSMSVADFCTGIILGPLYASLLFSRKLVGNCMSNEIRRYFATLFLGASALSVGILSIDRSLHLRKLQNYKLSDKVLHLILISNWFLPVAVPLIALADARIYSLVLFAFGALGVIVVIVSYVVLIISLKRYRSDLPAQIRTIAMNRERNAGKTVLIVVTCYIIMLLPLLIEKLLYSRNYFNERDKLERPKVLILAHLLCISNSVVNPIIYMYRITGLRDHLLKLLRKGEKTTVPNVSNNIS